MSKRQRLAAKRQLARQARSLSMRKAARIRRDLKVNDLGEFAPRVPSLKNIDRYNEKQLDSFIQQSEQYRSRQNQVVRLGSEKNYELITKDRWQQFDRQQRQRRDQARAAFKDIEGLLIPSKGQTIGDRRKELLPDRKGQVADNIGTMANPKRPEQITSASAMDRLENELKKYNEGGEHSIVRQKAMDVLDKMDTYFSAYGADDIMDQVRDLTDDQFFAL